MLLSVLKKKEEQQIFQYTEQNDYTLLMKGFRINLRITLQLYCVFFGYSRKIKHLYALYAQCLKAI